MSTADAARDFTSKWGDYFAESLPELGKIPENWAFLTDGPTKQIFWVNLKNGEVNSTHPHYGPLPQDWVVRIFAGEGDSFKARYYNTKTKETSKQVKLF